MAAGGWAGREFAGAGSGLWDGAAPAGEGGTAVGAGARRRGAAGEPSGRGGADEDGLRRGAREYHPNGASQTGKRKKVPSNGKTPSNVKTPSNRLQPSNRPKAKSVTKT